jgi:lysophospholipase L1-like esterase
MRPRPVLWPGALLRPHPTRRTFFWLALLVLPSLLLIGLLEAVLRLVGAERALNRIVTERLYPIREETGGNYNPFATRVFDPLLGWRLRPQAFLPNGRSRINSFGFVGPELDWHKRPGTRHVLCLGDSVTYGLWACRFGRFCHDAPYPEAIQRAWGAAGSLPLKAVNAGVFGYDSGQGLRYYTELGWLDADIVTVMFGWNDHGSAAGAPGRVLRNPVLRAFANGAAHLATYRVLAGGIAWLRASGAPAPAAMPPAGQHVPRTSLDDFAFHLERIVALARERGARVLLLTEPVGLDPGLDEVKPWTYEGLTDYEAWVAEHDRYNDATRAVAGRAGVPLVDADAAFRVHDRERLFDRWDLVHPNAAGHALIARLLLERMVQEGWLPR